MLYCLILLIHINISHAADFTVYVGRYNRLITENLPFQLMSCCCFEQFENLQNPLKVNFYLYSVTAHFLFPFLLQGIILVYDITRQETYNNIRKWLRYVDEVGVASLRILHHTGILSLKSIAHILP